MPEVPITDAVVALAGGVGGAKMAQGLAGVVEPGRLTAIVNTADDVNLWGLHISPDLDTVMYTLAGIANPVTGWGVVGDSHVTLDALARYGEDPWFSLGDKDFATHILRTQALARGETLTEVTTRLAQALGISVWLLPMTNDPVATRIRTGAQILDFQEYFVARKQQDVVDGVTFAGIDESRPTPGVNEAIGEADVIVFCPSNPIVSIAPILAVPGVREAIQTSDAVRIGVSPIVGGKALTGPADKMLTSLGHDASALGVARMYRDVLDIMVIDEIDAKLIQLIRELGLDVQVSQTVMGGPRDRERLAREILTLAQRSRSRA
ncbi:2-phospho-L-lactate transferase [soil metagenome]